MAMKQSATERTTLAIHCCGIVRIIYSAVSLWLTGLTRLASPIYVVSLDIGALDRTMNETRVQWSIHYICGAKVN